MIFFRTQHPKDSKTLFSTRMYGPLAFTPRVDKEKHSSDEYEELYENSPWPARNAPAFNVLNSFMER